MNEIRWREASAGLGCGLQVFSWRISACPNDARFSASWMLFAAEAEAKVSAMSRRFAVRSVIVALLSFSVLASGTAQEQRAVYISIDGVSPHARVVEGLSAAKSIHEVLPVRPPSIPGAIEGRVTVKFTVATDGTVKNAGVVHSEPLFDSAVLSAIRQWRFEPMRLNGAPVEPVMTRTATFPKAPGAVVLSGTRPVIEVPSPRLRERTDSAPAKVERGMRASMVVEVVVSPTGQVRAAQVLRNVSPEVDRVALDAIRKWTYEPTLVNALPVETVVVLTLTITS